MYVLFWVPTFRVGPATPSLHQLQLSVTFDVVIKQIGGGPYAQLSILLVSRRDMNLKLLRIIQIKPEYTLSYGKGDMPPMDILNTAPQASTLMCGRMDGKQDLGPWLALTTTSPHGRSIWFISSVRPTRDPCRLRKPDQVIPNSGCLDPPQ